MTDASTSKLFIPYLSQFRATYQKARRRIKKRIHSKQTSIVEATQLIETNIQQDQVDTEQTPVNALAAKNIETTQLIETNTQEETPDVKQYWEISNGRDSLYDIVIQTNPLMVQYIMSQL